MPSEVSIRSDARISWKYRIYGLTTSFAVFLFCLTVENIIRRLLLGTPYASFEYPDVALTAVVNGCLLFTAGIAPAALFFLILGTRGIPSLVECLLAGIFVGILYTKWHAVLSDIYFNANDVLLYSSVGVAAGLAAWRFWRRSPLQESTQLASGGQF